MQLISGIPLAALADVVQVVLPIIFMVFYILSQILGGREQAKRKAPPRPQRPKPPQALDPARPAPRQPPNQADALRREVEQFLRRAQGKPDPQEEPTHPKPEPQAPRQPPRRLVASAPDRPALSQTPLPSQISKKASRTSFSAPNLRREGVGEHVAKHVSSRKLAEHAEHLGEQMALTDERLESRLHEKFDHQLGNLQRQATAEPKKKEGPNITAQIVELLSQPDGMRQMIVANEILRRPDERWERG